MAKQKLMINENGVLEETWYNNRISAKLNQEYPFDFSICDVDGLVVTFYTKDNIKYKRMIIYESKNKHEYKKGTMQMKSLKILKDSINWKLFDKYSGVFVLHIHDINKEIHWYDIEGNFKGSTTFDQLYAIFSAKPPSI